jgi:hypothetical protein
MNEIAPSGAAGAAVGACAAGADVAAGAWGAAWPQPASSTTRQIVIRMTLRVMIPSLKPIC